jgi:hypothetical protein
VGNSQIFDNGTNVGIGTTSPSEKLEISGTNSLIKNRNIYIDSSQISFNRNPVTGGVVDPLLGTCAIIGQQLTGSSNLIFFTSSGSGISGFDERMRITSSGQMIIGDTSMTFGNNQGYVAGFKGASSSQTFISLAKVGQSLSSQGFMIGLDNSAAYLYNHDNTPMVFVNNAIERMRITSDGNVGIGTTSPGVKLEVNGLIRSIPVYNNTTATLANLVVTSGGTFERSVASSIRYKENVKDWDQSGLDLICALKPRTFKYKKDYYDKTNIEFLGLIAEEVSEVSSYLADYENEDRTGEVANVRYANIVVPLIKGIQELKAEIEQLKALINK